MHFVKQIRISQKRLETGYGAEVDCSAAIFCLRKILRVCIAENPPAKRDEFMRV
jgi:hypothetical protein